MRKVAQRFRRAIEMSDKNALPFSCRQFPNGSCGEAVVFLGTYLSENGYGEFLYVVGDRTQALRENLQSHAWLKKGNPRCRYNGGSIRRCSRKDHCLPRLRVA